MTSGPGEIRFFSVEEANRALPLVRRIVADIVQGNDELQERLPALKVARLRARRYGNDAELERLRREVAEISATLEDYLEELSRIGCLFKGPQGVVDFYALRDGRPVFLCWRHGEEAVAFWHELDAGYAGRFPIESSSLTGPPAGDR